MLASFDIASLPERLASKIRCEPDSGCWVWTASRHPKGYGQVYWRGKLRRAHRAIYEALVGQIPQGLVIDHLCRVRCCVNPAHLEPVTQRENLLRGEGFIAKQAAKTHCPQGHELSGANLESRYRLTGERLCLTCRNEWRRRQYRKRKAVKCS